MWNIPKDKNYPPRAVQCNGCGGCGCRVCDDKGWLPHDHPKGRRCANDACGEPIPPGQVTVYCSNACAASDA